MSSQDNLRFIVDKLEPRRVAAFVRTTGEFSTSCDAEEILRNELTIKLEALIYEWSGSVVVDTREVEHCFVVTWEEPATWWQSFKLQAIKDGNPFFDPAKIRMVDHHRVDVQTVRIRAELFPAAAFPDLNFPVEFGQPILYTRAQNTRSTI